LTGEAPRGTDEIGQEPVSLALLVEDPALADRLVAILSNVEGVRLVPPGQPADASLVSPALADAAASASDLALTPREREVLLLLSEGLSNKAIARRLSISQHTVKFHVGQLIDKLDATGRTDAVAHAARLGVIHL
jgi:DNA-binding CsgD family transcriptional regulator